MFQVITTRCAKFHRQFCRPGSRQLLCVQAWYKPVLLALPQDSFGLSPSEGPAVAKSITKLGQTFGYNFRQQLIDQEFDVAVCSVRSAAIFRGDYMGAQECRDDFQWLLSIQLAMQSQYLEFARHIQTIAAFRLDGRGPIRSE